MLKEKEEYIWKRKINGDANQTTNRLTKQQTAFSKVRQKKAEFCNSLAVYPIQSIPSALFSDQKSTKHHVIFGLLPLPLYA